MNTSSGTPRGLNLTPALFIVTFLFVALGTLDFIAGWPAAQRGLLILERTCPLREVAPSVKRYAALGAAQSEDVVVPHPLSA